ncbi:MAG: hypothetical protein ACOX2O_01470 [Bdellovibrionota bacterium]|jgi:hypothetical protein
MQKTFQPPETKKTTSQVFLHLLMEILGFLNQIEPSADTPVVLLCQRQDGNTLAEITAEKPNASKYILRAKHGNDTFTFSLSLDLLEELCKKSSDGLEELAKEIERARRVRREKVSGKCTVADGILAKLLPLMDRMDNAGLLRKLGNGFKIVKES